MIRLVTSMILLTFLIPYSLFAQNDMARSSNQNTSATYSVTFNATWSNETHPHDNFPTNPHFSRLIGATHNANATFWEADGQASLGIEAMAESGVTSILSNEVEAEMANNNALAVLLGGGIPLSPGSAGIDSFEVNQTYPLVTLVTMIAPSPDWFVGVSNLSLLDEQGQWMDSHVVTLYPYDSGTDSGPDYTSANDETDPPAPIARIRGEFPFSDEPIGTLTFTRLDEPQPKWHLYLPFVRR